MPIRSCARASLAASAACLFLSCAVSKRPIIPFDGPVPARWRQEAVIILADSTTWTLRREGDSNVVDQKSVTWYRINKRNPARLETLTFYDDESIQRPPAISVTVYKPEGGRQVPSASEMTRARVREPGHVSSNAFATVWRVPGYKAGMVIRTEMAATWLRPQFISQERVRNSWPTVHRSLALRAPAEYRLAAGLRGAEDLGVRCDTTASGGLRALECRADSLDKRDDGEAWKYPEERVSAFWMSLPPRGAVSPDWKTVGDGYLELIKASLEAKGLDSVPKITGAGPEEKVQAAFDLIQHRIRYLADEDHMNAFIPRPPSSVWANGYGDCKEMANLLRAICKGAGVELGLALIRSGDGIQLRGDFPSLGTYNHMIAWRRLPDGSLRWYDPTVSYGSASSSALHLMYQKALLLVPGATAPDTVMPADGWPTRIASACRLVRTGKEGPFTLQGEIAIKGAAAFDLGARLRYRDTHPEEARAALRNFLRDRFGIEANTCSVKSGGSDSLAIAFTHDRPVPDEGGLTLELPWLYRDEDLSRTGFVPPLIQEDAWILPAGYGRLQGKGCKTSRGDITWASASGTARRGFTGRLARPLPGAPAPEDSLSAHTTAWVGR